MNWHSQRVLVTGAGGFIGSHLAERLVRLGATVTASVRYNSRADSGLLRLLPADVRAAMRIHAGDLKDPDSVNKSVRGQQIIFHLGALIGIPYSYVHPIDYVQTNVIGTAHLLSAAMEQSVETFVQTSTSEVYGTAQYVPIDERHPLSAQSPYAASKIAGDQLALSYHRSFGLPAVIVRPFNTFGPRQSSRAIIPTIISQALRGDVVRLGSLSPRRDLTFVEDTVAGFIRAAEEKAAVGEVVNLGAGEDISIGDLAAKIFSLMGNSPRIIEENERVRPAPSEVERLQAGTEKARMMLGWAPTVSLEEGLRRTIAWIAENPSLYPTEAYHV